MSTVSYRRLINLGNYENESIGFDLPIDPGESHADALARVKALVMELAGKSDEARRVEERQSRARSEIYSLENKIGSVSRELEKAVAKHDQLRALLATHGVAIDPLDNWYRAKADLDADQSDEDSDDQEWEEDEDRDE